MKMNTHLSPHSFISSSLHLPIPSSPFLIRQVIQMLHGFVSGGATVEIGNVQFCLIKEIFSVQMRKLCAIMGTVFVDRAQTTLSIQKLAGRAVVADVPCRFLDV